jgi:serine/threonine protein kinase
VRGLVARADVQRLEHGQMVARGGGGKASSDGAGVTPEDLGPYRVLRPIGSGGMASIHEALDTRLGRRVAIKRLHPHIAARPGAAERFLREGRAAAKIRHPHVVHVLSLSEEGAASPYLAMELLEGRDLGDCLARDGRLSVEAALAILLPVIAGVAAAHDAGIVHRDLKPSNVFVAVGARGRPLPKVLDFGVSKVLEGSGGSVSTATDGVVGTAVYMAPEQARTARDASFLSDQYSLAVMLYQCLTGELPFAKDGVYDLMVAIMTAPIEAPGQRVAGVPGELDAVILRAMSRSPDARFPSVRVFGAALLPFAAERDRVAWTHEMHEPPEIAPATAPDGVPPPGATYAPGTMSPTARDTRAASGSRDAVLRRRLLPILAMGLLGASALFALRAPPTSAGASATALAESASSGEAPSPASSIVAPAEPPAAIAAPVSLTTASPPHPFPSVVLPRQRSTPAPAASPASASPSAVAAPSAASLGSNGAPILP